MKTIGRILLLAALPTLLAVVTLNHDIPDSQPVSGLGCGSGHDETVAPAPLATVDHARPTSHAIALESGAVAELAPTLEAAPGVDEMLDTIGERSATYAGLCGAVCQRVVDDPALPTHYDDAAVTYGIGRQRVVPATYRVEAVDLGARPAGTPPLLRF